MLQATWAIVEDGQIKLLDPITFPEGTKLIVTALTDGDDESAFWLDASTSSLDTVWNNNEDDVYAELLDE